MIFVNVNANKTHHVVSLLDVASNIYLDAEINFETHVKNWFRNAAQRYAREQQQKSSNQTHLIIDVPEFPIQGAALQ